MTDMDHLPPGEHGTELTGAAALQAIQAGFATVAKRAAPDVAKWRISPCAIDAFRDGRWIVVVIRFRKPARSFTVKLTRSWAELLRLRLCTVLGK